MPASSSSVPQPPIRVTPSAPIELMWLIHWAGADHLHGGEFVDLDGLSLRHRGDLEKLWGERLAQYSTEMLVLAVRSGTMRDSDLKRFFSRIEAAIDDTAFPSLLSESAEEREITRERLERIRADAGFRKRYVGVLSSLWTDMEREWETKGRPSVLAEVQKWQRVLEGGAPFRQLLQVEHIWPPRPEIDGIADAAAAEGNMFLTPAWFGGMISVLEFDGIVYVGRGIRHEGPSLKQVAADIASNAKTLSDPTRVAILLSLARESASVTEIARHFQLSQPTVSAHVQMLREAGLLEEKTVGRSAQLSASQEGVRRLFAGAEDALIRAFQP